MRLKLEFNGVVDVNSCKRRRFNKYLFYRDLGGSVKMRMSHVYTRHVGRNL